MLKNRSDFRMRARLRDAWSVVSGFLKRAAGCRRAIRCVPRAETHRIVFDVRGIPRRLLRSSLRLRLQQFLGAGQYGFCYTLDGESAEVWYWREHAESLAVQDAERGKDCEPWPEPLLREPLRDGIHLVTCTSGYEGVVVRAQKTVQTRWFADYPGAKEWTAFVRDGGGGGECFDPPPARDVRSIDHPPRGWYLHSSLTAPVSAVTLGALGVISVVGALGVVSGVYSLKLGKMVDAETAAFEKLTKEHAVTIALQKEIDAKEGYLRRFRGVRPRFTQLELMNSLQESGVLGGGDKISLAEWEYRNSRLRMLFMVPASGFALGQFLGAVEKLPVFQEIKLMPDTPQGTVGVQATIGTVMPEHKSPASDLANPDKP